MEDYNLLTFRWRDIIMYPKTEDGNSDVWETTNMWIQSWQYCLLKFCDTDVTPSHLARQPLRFEPQFEPCVWGLFLCYQYYHWIRIMMHKISPFGHWVACGCTMHLVNPHQSNMHTYFNQMSEFIICLQPHWFRVTWYIHLSQSHGTNGTHKTNSSYNIWCQYWMPSFKGIQSLLETNRRCQYQSTGSSANTYTHWTTKVLWMLTNGWSILLFMYQ